MTTKTRKACFYQTTNQFEPAKNWLLTLKDKLGRAKIFARIKRAELGNFGDHKGIGEGVSELRISHGPGYRIYFGIDNVEKLIILLEAGDKSSQEKDII